MGVFGKKSKETKEEPVKRSCYVARDRGGDGLVGFYKTKPTEVTCKDSKPEEGMKYYRAVEGSLIHVMTYASFMEMYKQPLGLGECYEASFELVLKV